MAVVAVAALGKSITHTWSHLNLVGCILDAPQGHGPILGSERSDAGLGSGPPEWSGAGAGGGEWAPGRAGRPVVGGGRARGCAGGQAGKEGGRSRTRSD